MSKRHLVLFLRQTLILWVLLSFSWGVALAQAMESQPADNPFFYTQLPPALDLAASSRQIAECSRLLQAYLAAQNSVLVQYSAVFAEEAYKHNLDCTLVVAIAGQESAFGRYFAVPYNAWGWGGGWDPAFGFASWEEGIRVISESLDTRYCRQWHACNDPDAIGHYWAEDPNWHNGVSHYMSEIKAFGNSPDYLLSETAPN